MLADMVFQALGGLVLLALVAWAGWRWRVPSRAPEPGPAVPGMERTGTQRAPSLASHFHRSITNEDEEPLAPPTPAKPRPPPLQVDQALIDQDAIDTFNAIGRTVSALLAEGKVERTPRVDELLQDLSALTVYALGTRKYRKGGTH